MNAQQLRNSILQEAICGNLTAEWRKKNKPTQSGAQLLAEIQKHRPATKGKKQTFEPITDDEIPFDIPESWCWCRLGEISDSITKGASPKWQGVNYVDENKGILFVTSENVGKEKLLWENKKFVERKFNEIQPRSILKQGDVLTNIVGGSIGRTALFNLEINDANTNQAVAIIRLSHLQMGQFIVKMLNTPFAFEQMTKGTVDTARANISLGVISDFLVPLPPLAEQKEIVRNIEEIFEKIDNLR